MKLFEKAYKVEDDKFIDYISKSCDEDPEQFIRRKNYFDYYGNNSKNKLDRKKMHYDTIQLLDNSKTCEKFKDYILSDPKNADDAFKIRWGSANLLKDEDNEICYLDALHDIYNKDVEKAENVFLETTKLRNLLDKSGKTLCDKTKKELEKRLNKKNSTMKMTTSRRKTSRRKTSRRKTSRRKTSRRKTSRRKTSRRKTSRRKH
jgi:hypothetical protein